MAQISLPTNQRLPFFSYGLFQPGQIGFRQLSQLVEMSEGGWKIHGSLLERDGLPVLVTDRPDSVSGTLILFRDGVATDAYRTIVAIEPGNVYRWQECEVARDGAQVRANVLVGRSPRRGSHPLEGSAWDGSKDPLFYPALEVVGQCIEENRTFEWNLKPLLRLQMAYALLWSGIERFTAFKYNLGKDAWEKVEKLSSDPVFAAALKGTVNGPRDVYRADDPSERVTLDPISPERSLKYYYQIRSNIVHRGKAAVRDHETLVKSLEELAAIFRKVLDAEFSAGRACMAAS